MLNSIVHDEVQGQTQSDQRDLEDGITQIYYVFGGRLTSAEAAAFRMMVEIVLSPEALAHTTLVRTKFKHFDRPSACDQDRAGV